MGLLHPAACAYAILIGVLIALYLRDRRRPPVDVPSLLLWQQVPEASERHTRVRIDLLFLLQCALLAVMILGLADPYFSAQRIPAGAARHVFILDGSASMQARESQTTRFEQARQALGQRLATIGDNDEAMLIIADHAPHVVTAFSRDRATLMSELSRLEPVDAAADLDLALAVAHHAAGTRQRSTHVEVFTDLPRAELRRAWDKDLVWWRFGESDGNVAIESLRVFQGRFQEHDEARAEVIVQNHSRQEAHGGLTLRLNGRPITQEGFSLDGGARRVFRHDGFPEAGVLEALLETDDALAADNRAFGQVLPVEPLRLLVITPSSAFQSDLERITAAARNIRVRYVTPSELRPDSFGDADIVIFYRFVPETIPDRASLILYPTEDRGWLKTRGAEHDLEIVDWNQRHPVMRGIRPELPFPVSRPRLLDAPAWGEVLLTTQQNGGALPLAFCGMNRGHPLAVVGFDPVVDSLLHPDHVDLLLFFLNLLDWLAPSKEAFTLLRTGETHVLPGDPAPLRSGSDPHDRPLSLPDGGPLRIDVRLAGEYRVRAGGTEHRLFANFFDPRESAIGRAEAEAEPAAPAEDLASAVARPGAIGFGFWLYAAAIALFVVEWGLAARRERRS